VIPDGDAASPSSNVAHSLQGNKEKVNVICYKPEEHKLPGKKKDGINLKKVYRGTIRSPVLYERHAQNREALLGVSRSIRSSSSSLLCCC
jgi:hypothetical protein